MIKVTIWNEYRHELMDPKVSSMYPKGIHGQLASFLQDEFEVITVRIERPGHENALTPEQRLHISETELDNWDFDVVLTALNQPELYRQVITKLIPKLLGEELGGLGYD